MKLFFRVLLSLICLGAAQAALPMLYLKPLVLDQIHAPTTIVAANDGSGRVFVCDQPGRIHILKDGMMLPTPFLDISITAVNVAHRKVIGLGGVGGAEGVNYDERGLLGLAFHPDYENASAPGYRKFYLNYNKPYQAGIDPPPHDGGAWTPNCTTVIAEFQVSVANPNVADPLSERKLLLYPEPQSNHNGGGLLFSPDGMLYIAAGDGGNSNDNGNGHSQGSGTVSTNFLGNAQDKTNYLGKIHRINPLDPDGAGALTYSIPTDNPFFNDSSPVGLKKEIFVFGIRNPWGMTLDKRPGGTGKFYSADVGQGRVEEVNVIQSGGNYGWRYLEGHELPSFSSGAGTNPMPNPGGPFIYPMVEYAHPNATVANTGAYPPGGANLPQLGLSITGGSVYRGTAIPAMQGSYIFGDYGSTGGAASGRLMALEPAVPGGDVSTGAYTFHTAVAMVGPNPFPIRVLCLGEDESGEIYLGGKVTGGVLAMQTGLPNGAIYKIMPAPAVVSTTTLEPMKDNSIFGELSPLDEELSNGTGNLFAGRTGAGVNRRALMQFDVSSIPAGSTIVSASVQMTVNTVDGANPGAKNFNLHKLRESWGEAGSFSATGGAAALDGDATFDNRFYSATTPMAWSAGTDMPYWASSSAVTSVNLAGNYTWGHQLAGDVRSWLRSPATNLGWILVGDETGGGIGSAKQMDSRESGASVRPKLTVIHVPPTGYEAWREIHFPGLPIGTYIDPSGDSDGDGIKAQIEYAYGFSPLSFNVAGSDNFTTAQAPAGGGGTEFTVTFRRDSSAVDLTYQLQTSEDLINWTTIASSVAGAAAGGQNDGTVLSDVVLTGTIRVVMVKQTLAAGADGRRFTRLRVDRTL